LINFSAADFMALCRDSGELFMLPSRYRLDRVQRTLRRFEEDIPLLNMRVKDLSAERQKTARQFATALIDRTRAELHRLLEEQPEREVESCEVPCEPAD
jgi:hypothetical protein